MKTTTTKAMSKPSVVIGIDNGVDGGLCALDFETSQIIEYTVTPSARYGKKNEVDCDAVTKWLRRLSCGTDAVVAIEEPLHHAPSSQSMRSMGISFGKYIGICQALGLPLHRVQVLDWQRKMLGRVPAGKTKVFALQAANKLWPEQSWLASNRCRTPHDGIVDAALVAKYTIDHLPL
jgi:hypothetical protein